MHLPVIPENAPFNDSQRLWLNGYLAGIFSGSSHAAPANGNVVQAPSLGSLCFLFGTQTGGSETLAKKFAKEAKKQGFETAVIGMDAYSGIDFSKPTRIAIVTSTYGDGEMPDNAQGFWDFLSGTAAPHLGNVEFSVLALGDLNYPLFCEAGKKFDARFAGLGAKRVYDRVDCDVDFDAPAATWFKGLLSNLTGSTDPVADAVEENTVDEDSGYGKNRPFPAPLKSNRKISLEGSAKETRHVELVLDGSGLEYEAGDALGVMPRNCPEFVQEILQASGLTGDEAVTLVDGTSISLRSALVEKLDLKPFVTALPAAGHSAAELVAPLRKLQPRLYSIASSPKAHPGEVHLTVGVVRYEVEGRGRKGVCSTFLADFDSRVGNQPVAPVFIHKSSHFRLPADTTKPVIMVGPGTGIAPFRSFLQERRATGAKGKNWLFFGDQKKSTDFLYQDELSTMFHEGHLTRLDLAFSRDQEEKTYVQHRMLENAAELWSWFQEGASFYVCGDAQRMAKDVESALLTVASQAGGYSEEAASEWLATLKRDKRYLRDVY